MGKGWKYLENGSWGRSGVGCGLGIELGLEASRLDRDVLLA